MAQTSSATREPSMEEILASIRRIIEDSDVTRQGAGDDMQDTASSESPVPFLRHNEKRGEIAPFRRPGFAESEQEDYAADRADSAAPVAANQLTAPEISTQQVSELPGSNSDVHQPALSQPLSLQAVLRGTLSSTLRDDEQRAEQHQQTVSDLRVATVNPPVPPVVRAVATVQPVVSLVPDTALEDASEQDTVQPELPTVTHVETAMTDKPLISESASRQVAASFGSLSDAVYAEQMRLMDEKTEAMLRPMLQNWLDTNLPPLVERLVREEIERVVRGANS